MAKEHSNGPLRAPTCAARMKLVAQLALRFSVEMQDWEWEVADGGRFGEFLDLYCTGNLNDDERISLMEILIQSGEDMEPPSEFDAAWSALEPLLLSRPELHRSTIMYWACLHETEPAALFRVSANMRKVWRALSA